MDDATTNEAEQVAIRFEPFDSALRDAYRQLLPAHEGAVARGKLEWKFAGNPAGAGDISVARDADGRTIGMTPFQAVDFRVAGDTVPGSQSLDSVVAPEARGRGVYTRLISAFYHGTDRRLLYGFPNNRTSTPLFGRFGWERYGSVPMMVRPLSTGLAARKLRFVPDLRLPVLARPAGRWERVERFTDEDTALWRRWLPAQGAAVDRTAEWLNWRLFDHPTTRYRVLRGPSGGWVAHTVADKHGGRIGYLMDAIGEDGDELAGLIATALRQMQGEGAELAFAWSLPHAPNHRAHRRAGFYPFPDRLRPIEINFGAVTLPIGTPPIPASDWYISYLDSDTV